MLGLSNYRRGAHLRPAVQQITDKVGAVRGGEIIGVWYCSPGFYYEKQLLRPLRIHRFGCECKYPNLSTNVFLYDSVLR